jgi:hypothetical protein
MSWRPSNSPKCFASKQRRFNSKHPKPNSDYINQGILTERDDSLHLTSSLRQPILQEKKKNIFNIKIADLNMLVKGGQTY